MEKPFRTVEATPPAPPALPSAAEAMPVPWPPPDAPPPPPKLGDTTRYAAEIPYPAVEQTAPFKLQGG